METTAPTTYQERRAFTLSALSMANGFIEDGKTVIPMSALLVRDLIEEVLALRDRLGE